MTCAGIFASISFGVKAESLDGNLFDLDLAQLSEINITSLAKKPQKISMAASSIYVLDQEQIKRSGATSIADALRLVPGVQVAKLDANKWAISIRGFNDILSNKLLILMDGRSVYSPFFGGAYWDTVDTVLADIERIEVIKGPGGTLWGANAVNGVINIITKKTQQSAGLLVSAIAGTEELGNVTLRYGGDIDADTHYKVYAKGFERDKQNEGVDDWRMGRLGFRVDSRVDGNSDWMMQGEVYAGQEGEKAVSPFNEPPFGNFASATDVFGGHLLLQWRRQLSETSHLNFQAYYDRAERSHFYVSDERDTFDFDLQHRFELISGHELNWGLAFRYIGDQTQAGTVTTLIPQDRSDQIYSAFIQDEISLIKERLILTLGTKIEHNTYTGFEYQPSARLLWKFHDQQSMWGSVSRAIRHPSRIEQDMVLQRGFLLSNTDVALDILGNRDMESEELLAYELGYRFLGDQFSFDISAFYNDYDRLRTVEFGELQTSPKLVFPLIIANEMDGEVYGFEFAGNWQVYNNWRLAAGYSFVQMQLHLAEHSTDRSEEGDEGDTPHHQFNLQSYWQINEDWQFDGVLKYVDMVRQTAFSNKESVGAYFAVDLRLAWQPYDELELAVVGQNLAGKHREFRGSTVDTQATDVETGVYFKADLRY